MIYTKLSILFRLTMEHKKTHAETWALSVQFTADMPLLHLK